MLCWRHGGAGCHAAAAGPAAETVSHSCPRRGGVPRAMAGAGLAADQLRTSHPAGVE